LGTTLTN